jgi:DnaK suppressor protein
MSVDVERFRSALLEERRRVQHAMQYIHDEHPETGDETNLSTHLMDNAALTLEQEMDDTLEENSGNVLAEIDAALERIDAGTYGMCASCSEGIAPERLEALPHATLCIDCKRREAEQ